MQWVIDCSFFSSLFLPDESSKKASAFFKGLKTNESIWVPALWWQEVVSVINTGVARGRLTHVQSGTIFSLINEFELNTDHAEGVEYAEKLFEVARLYDLSAYDAAYLELCIRKKACCASFDKTLLNAAKKCGVHLILVKSV